MDFLSKIMSSVEETREVEIPPDVEVTIKDSTVRIKGKLGEVVKVFKKMKGVSFKVENGKFIASAIFPKGPRRAYIGTICSIVKNAIIGVTQGYKVRSRLVYAHKAMRIKVEGNIIYISNFLGGSAVHKYKLPEGVKAEVIKIDEENTDIEFFGTDKEKVNQAAYGLMLKLKIRDKDPRLFNDNIYPYRKYIGDKLVWRIV